MSKLTKDQKKILRSSSREAVQQAFTGTSRHFRRSRWLGLNNRYRENCVERVGNAVGSSSTLTDPHLAEYIAASAPLHCADGWSYLGRALVCHAEGDRDSARH